MQSRQGRWTVIDGQLGPGGVCSRDRAAVELDECCGGRGNLSGIPRPLVHPRLRAGGWESIARCYPHDVPAVQPPLRLGHAENCESVDWMVKTDAVIEPVATAVDDGGSCNGDSVAAAEACGRGRDRAQLRGLSASWGIGDAACGKSGKANLARHSGSNRALLVGYSRGPEWHPQQNTDIRRFSDSRQAGPVVGGPTLERSGGRPQNALLIPVSRSEIARVVKMTFEELGCNKLGRCGVQPETRGTVMGLLEEVPRSRRNPATRSLAQFVECPQVHQIVKTSESMQLVEFRQAEFGRYCEDTLERLLAAPMGARCFSGLAIDASSTLGILRRA